MKKVSIPIIGIVSDYADHEIPPGFFNEIWNAQPLEGFSKTATQNVKGFTLKSETYPSGVNTCIGMYTDKINNRLFYFLHNSNSNHSIWYFNPIDDAHTLVMQTEFLNFSTDHPILSATFLDDILQWTDGENEARSILVSRAVANDLFTFTTQSGFEKQCSLYKPAPKLPPTVSRFTEADGSPNNIAADSFQFVAQYVYHDNSVSDIGPISKLSPAEAFPTGVLSGNSLPVSQVIDSELVDVVKAVRFSFIKNGNGIYNLCKEINNEDFDFDGSNYSAGYRFRNNDVTEVITPSYTNFIPQKTNNILIHAGRNYLSLNFYDYPDFDGCTLSAIKTSRATLGTPYNDQIFIPNSSSTIGLVFFDEFGRTNGVLKKTTVTFPDITKVAGEFTISDTEQLHIQWSISGDPPSWAKSYAIVVKKSNTYSSYWKGMAFILFYLKTDTESTNNVLDNGKVFYASAQNSYSRPLYLKLPANLPFTLDESYKVRLINDFSQSSSDTVQDIISVDGDKIVVNNFGISAWATALGGASGPYGMLNISLEKPKQEQDEFYYEVGANYDCSDGTFSTTTGIISGEYFYMPTKFKFNPSDNGNSYSYGGVLGDSINRTDPDNVVDSYVISESPTHANVKLENIVQNVKKQNKTADTLRASVDSASTIFPGWVALAKITRTDFISNLANTIDPQTGDEITSDITNVFAPDYSKRANNFGRTWVEVRNKQQRSDPTLMSISDTFVIGTSINGLNKFRNVYSLPLNRTAIRKLVDIGQSNIFLSIGERSTTSLSTYSGDNILHTQDGGQLLGDGRGIIGYDRELAGGFGTLYPDSVTSYNGKVWWFDPYQGEVCRYSNNGISPIGSQYKMHNFFKEKGQQFMDTTGRNIVSGYDPELSIIYMTFRSSNADEEITVAFIDREGEERWYSFYDFLPDRYAYIGERLFSFKDGGLWEHKVNSTYGLFYGEQKTLSLNHKFNAEFSKPKFLTNISLVSNDRWTVNPITTTNPEYGDQETRLSESNFVNKQGRFYADVKRDINTSVGMLPAGKSGLVAGRRCVGEIFDITLENDSTEKVDLKSIEYGYVSESGHR